MTLVNSLSRAVRHSLLAAGGQHGAHQTTVWAARSIRIDPPHPSSYSSLPLPPLGHATELRSKLFDGDGTSKSFPPSENAVRFGKPALLENILESLYAALEPLLVRQTLKHSGQEMIQLGDSAVP
jgi:hypothetical protein